MHMRRNTFFENQEPGTGWESGSFKESKRCGVDLDRKFFGVWCEQ
jgi:hypothetical protein